MWKETDCLQKNTEIYIIIFSFQAILIPKSYCFERGVITEICNKQRSTWNFNQLLIKHTHTITTIRQMFFFLSIKYLVFCSF